MGAVPYLLLLKAIEVDNVDDFRHLVNTWGDLFDSDSNNSYFYVVWVGVTALSVHLCVQDLSAIQPLITGLNLITTVVEKGPNMSFDDAISLSTKTATKIWIPELAKKVNPCGNVARQYFKTSHRIWMTWSRHAGLKDFGYGYEYFIKM